MIRLGEKQVLDIVRVKDFGVYVGDEEEAGLLPKNTCRREAVSAIRSKCLFTEIPVTVSLRQRKNR